MADVDVQVFPAITAGNKNDLGKRWISWAENCLRQQTLPRISPFCETEAAGVDQQHTLASSALFAAASSKPTLGELNLTDACAAFFHKAWQASPLALHAAGVLLDRSLHRDANSADILYLCAAFAWPLQKLVASELSLRAWWYLIRTSWNCEARVWHDIARNLQKRPLPPERDMSAMIETKLKEADRWEARAILEAILTEGHPESLSTVSKPNHLKAAGVKRLGRGLQRLAKLHAEDKTSAVYARAIIDLASKNKQDPRLPWVLQKRVWDRPFEECTTWAKGKPSLGDLDRELQRVLGARQPHHARRLCEALILQDCGGGNVPTAIGKLCQLSAFNFSQKKPTTVQAATYLSVFYATLNVYHQHALKLITRTLGIAPLSRGDGPLVPWADYLSRYLAKMTPMRVVAEEFEQYEEIRPRLTPEEQALLDDVARWFNGRWDGGSAMMSALNNVTDFVLWPVGYFTSLVGEKFSALEYVLTRFFNMVASGGVASAGNIDALLEEGESVRRVHGFGTTLLAHSQQKTRLEKTAAIATAASMGALQQVVQFPGSGGITMFAALVAAFRSVARIGGIWGIDVRDPKGKNFVADAFLLGTCSPKRAAQAVVRYLVRRKRNPFPTAAVGALDIVVMEGLLDGCADGVAKSVEELARVCGIQLSEYQLGWEIMPFFGAVMSAANAGIIVHSISEAAVYIAARETLQDRAKAYNDKFCTECGTSNSGHPSSGSDLNVDLTCPQCGKTNRVPRSRLADRPVCGSCRAPLPTG